MLISMPCKFSAEHPYIFEAVERIKDNMPDAKVIVFDSNSEDKSYIDKLKVPVYIGNANYETGPIWSTHYMYPYEDFYYFLHDSIFLKKDISEFCHEDISCISWFPAWAWSEPIEIDWAKQVLPQTEYSFSDIFTSIFGSAFGCTPSVLDQLKNNRFDRVRPVVKWQSMAMERLWGLALDQQGYGGQLVRNSIYGELDNIWNLDNEFFTKKIVKRP